MSVEAVIRLPDQFPVEPLFTGTRFISCNQEDRLAFRIEGKRYSPFTIGSTEPQLLHIRVARAVHRIDAGSPQLRSELLQEPSQRQNFNTHVLSQCEELRLKLVADFNDPRHTYKDDIGYI